MSHRRQRSTATSFGDMGDILGFPLGDQSSPGYRYLGDAVYLLDGGRRLHEHLSKVRPSVWTVALPGRLVFTLCWWKKSNSPFTQVMGEDIRRFGETVEVFTYFI
jgi:hypothetical protein